METSNTKDIDNIDIKAIYSYIWKRKYFVLKILSLFFILSVVLAIFAPNIYSSKAILAPANLEDSLSAKLGEFSSFSGFSGLSLLGENSDPSVEAVQRIISYDFFNDYVLPNIQLENLFAVKKWIPESNTIEYKGSIYDAKTKKWVRDVKFPFQPKPSSQEAYEVYEKIINITQDRRTSFVSISIEHQSPHIAKKWLDLIISNINESMREEDKENASNAIIFLNETSKTTNNNQLKKAIAILLEDQMQDLMLASAHKDYVFKTIDSPLAPEEESSPNRFIIVFIGLFIGTIIAISAVLFSYLKSQLTKSKLDISPN